MFRLLFPVLLILISELKAQDSISLKNYCPAAKGQYKATCASYAPCYTALSILYNVRNQVSDENNPAFTTFSPGFVASEVKRKKGFFGKMFNQCGKNVTVDMTLGVLLHSGTVLYSQFTQGCDCGRVTGLLAQAAQYRISDTVVLGDNSTAPATHIQSIKACLQHMSPVVITLYQESFFSNHNGSNMVSFPANYTANSISANHVICIIGYNDTIAGGSFLVKNNYTNWGINGFSYVRYTDMIKLIRDSYQIIL